MIINDTIVLGLGTVSVGYSIEEPNRMFLIEHPVGKYDVGTAINSTQALENGSKVKGSIKFNDFTVPLQALKNIKQAKTLNANVVDLNGVYLDFTRSETDKTWDIVEEWFLTQAKRMAKNKGVSYNDFSITYFEIVGD